MKAKTILGLEIYTRRQKWLIGIAIAVAIGLITLVMYTEGALGDYLLIWVTYALGCAALYWRLMTRGRKTKTPRR